jgi:hypothetical protein
MFGLGPLEIVVIGALAVNSPLGWPVIPAHVELAKVDTQYGKGPNILNRLRGGLAGSDRVRQTESASDSSVSLNRSRFSR